ncbi:hypothetical protein MLOOGBEN_06655 [Bacillus sp. EB106-08-02-XG196]|uniref:hypothetical protein n=1 Tax=Bacillus sp. EB106-08-02-XG196 TaxID=2737049 RepID=UPI0015C490F5|nr:hypothetical protein [Bacillus sp. EB106-08-02-XG196]NWQ40378.1 hypothetical protein [Bacillus sp. EB106-08-02-XG196]
MTVRIIKAVYTVSDDPDFGIVEDEVYLLSPQVIFERHDNDAVIIIPNEPVRDDQNIVYVDRADCGMLEVDFLEGDNERVNALGLEWLANASFLEVIYKLAVKK